LWKIPQDGNRAKISFFAAYKQDRFYWKIVLSLRKIIIVGLGVFGPSLGAVRQAQVALLVLFIFIVLKKLYVHVQLDCACP
jgi:hypothetical protein